ncbi:zinc finger, C2H2 type [Teladorsagia circumcincta]|uniref:Fumarylacetoacetase n=1 Tax=Teladorsagia circumcincta TaxID=45464 RepID=A0A2G9URV9_TELCI|nr:zinc finger, C2H2 type [Teladorsagia circumcincta]
MLQCTKCQICGVNADSPIDLQVHLYSDHISIRDGKDLKCPKRNCDKVYPNKDSLRLHIVAHYQHCVDATLGIEGREDDSVSSVTSLLASRLTEDISDQRGSPLSDESDSSWPSADVSRVASASDLKRSQEDEVGNYPCPVRCAISRSTLRYLCSSTGLVMCPQECTLARYFSIVSTRSEIFFG